MINKLIEPVGEVVVVSKKKRPIICVQTGDYYESACEAARVLNKSRATIAMVVSGHKKSYEGFIFRYATSDEINLAENFR
jgi:hypothetical protein